MCFWHLVVRVSHWISAFDWNQMQDRVKHHQTSSAFCRRRVWVSNSRTVYTTLGLWFRFSHSWLSSTMKRVAAWIGVTCYTACASLHGSLVHCWRCSLWLLGTKSVRKHNPVFFWFPKMFPQTASPNKNNKTTLKNNTIFKRSRWSRKTAPKNCQHTNCKPENRCQLQWLPLLMSFRTFPFCSTGTPPSSAAAGRGTGPKTAPWRCWGWKGRRGCGSCVGKMAEVGWKKARTSRSAFKTSAKTTANINGWDLDIFALNVAVLGAKSFLVELFDLETIFGENQRRYKNHQKSWWSLLMRPTDASGGFLPLSRSCQLPKTSESADHPNSFGWSSPSDRAGDSQRGHHFSRVALYGRLWPRGPIWFSLQGGDLCGNSPTSGTGVFWSALYQWSGNTSATCRLREDCLVCRAARNWWNTWWNCCMPPVRTCLQQAAALAKAEKLDVTEGATILARWQSNCQQLPVACTGVGVSKLVVGSVFAHYTSYVIFSPRICLFKDV